VEQAFGLYLHLTYGGNFNLGGHFFTAACRRNSDLVKLKKREYTKMFDQSTFRLPKLPVMVIIYINVAFYFLALMLDSGGIFSNDSTLRILSPSDKSLFLLGASGTIPVIQAYRFWTLISASFLHGGVLHILFNMIALYLFGPFVLREFGFHRFINLYIISGIAGIATSVLFGVPFTIGASASICGLIGAIIYYGKSRGDHYRDSIYIPAMIWVIVLIGIGLISSNWSAFISSDLVVIHRNRISGSIDNWAPIGGLLSGIFLAFIMGYDDKQESATVKLLAYAFIMLTVVVLIWAAAGSLLSFKEISI
jgi:rhomboid protease GluP